jgi:hypothetical protein
MDLEEVVAKLSEPLYRKMLSCIPQVRDSRIAVLAKTSSNLPNQSAKIVMSWQLQSVVNCEHGSTGISTVRSRYQAMTSEDITD